MCTVLLPPGVNPTAAKYISYISNHIIYHVKSHQIISTIISNHIKYHIKSYHISNHIKYHIKCLTVTCQCFSFPTKISVPDIFIIPCGGLSTSTKYVIILVCINEMGSTVILRRLEVINPLNAELNPICYLLALLGAHHFLHVSRIRVKSLTLRQLMSYIYGAPILDVSRSHTTHHSR